VKLREIAEPEYPLEADTASGRGWFIPEWEKQVGLVQPDGRATFAFAASQEKSGDLAQLNFKYDADDLTLRGTSCDWIAVSATEAIFEGIGTINNAGSYRFRVRAVDGDRVDGGAADRFEIRIWTGAGDSFESPLYRAEGDLGGGHIVVHKT
jgi:hypothetical protein